ncbi:MAG: tetratricopeptide repeat protein [bacterium]
MNSPAPEHAGRTPGSWLHSFGAFLFVPLFALIVVLLFWQNNDAPMVNGADAPQARGSNMAAMEQVHKTLNRLKSRLEAHAEDVVAMDSLAIMYTIAGNYEKAKAFYEMHMDVEPENKDVKIALALTHNNLSNHEKAIALIQEVLDREPTYAFGLHYMAEILASIHNHEEAEKYWRQIIEHYPGTEMAKVAEQRIDAGH